MTFNPIFGSDRLYALQSRTADAWRVLVQAWLLAVLLALIAYAVWTLDRGFDLTDESYYLLNAIYPGEIRLFATAAHWITPWLWKASGSLVAFRALGLAMLLLSAQVLAFGVLQAARQCGLMAQPTPGQRFAVSACTMIGALLYGSFVNYAPSYNLVTACGCYAAIGLALLSSRPQSGWRAPAWQLLAGAALAIVTLCKFSAGAAALGVTLLLALIFLESPRARITGIALIVAGFGGVLALMVMSHGGLDDAVRQFRLGMSIGALLYGSFVNYAPSYNLVTTCGCYAAVGLALLSSRPHGGWRAPVWQLLAGATLAVVTLCKFSAGAAALGVTLLLALIFLESPRTRIIGIALIVAGFGGVLALMVMSHGGLDDAVRQFRLGMSIGALAIEETILERLERYYDELYLHGYLLGQIFAVPLLCLVLAAMTRSTLIALAGIGWFAWFGWLGWDLNLESYLLGGTQHYRDQAFPLLALMALCAVAAVPEWRRDWRPKMTAAGFLILAFCFAVGSGSLALLVLCLLATARRWGANWRACTLFAALFALPYGIAVGTGNQITVQLLFSLAPWGALIALLAFANGRSAAVTIPAQLACAAFALLIAAQVFTSGLNAPYRLHRPLDQQTESTGLGTLGSVRLDAETAQFVRQIRTIAAQCGIDGGQRHFLGLYNIPGIALLTHTIPAFTPWMFMQKYTEAILDTVPADSYRDAVVGIQLGANDAPPPMPRQLATFPQGYRLCGSAVIPYQQQKIQLWVPEQSHAR